MGPLWHRACSPGRRIRRMLKLFCWVCFTRRPFSLPHQCTLAVCSECGNPEGAMRSLAPYERVWYGLDLENPAQSDSSSVAA